MFTIFQKDVPIESMSTSNWYLWIVISEWSSLCWLRFLELPNYFAVVLRDVTHKSMRDLLQFMYHGEVSVKREDLTSFIRTAEALQIKGLTNKEVSVQMSVIDYTVKKT